MLLLHPAIVLRMAFINIKKSYTALGISVGLTVVMAKAEVWDCWKSDKVARRIHYMQAWRPIVALHALVALMTIASAPTETR